MRRFVLLGGGSIREKTTLKIDEYIANTAKSHAGENRAYALFFPTASHDSKPYFNSFRKIYTSCFDIKSDVALLSRDEMSLTRIQEKIDKADIIYVGGGDTPYMMSVWRQSGVDKLILEAYSRGVTVCGLSAGAICWFEKMYTDTDIVNGVGTDYKLLDGFGVLEGLCCPHYNERYADFDEVAKGYEGISVYALENDSALVFENEQLVKKLGDGSCYLLSAKDNQLTKREL